MSLEFQALIFSAQPGLFCEVLLGSGSLAFIVCTHQYLHKAQGPDSGLQRARHPGHGGHSGAVLQQAPQVGFLT